MQSHQMRHGTVMTVANDEAEMTGQAGTNGNLMALADGWLTSVSAHVMGAGDPGNARVYMVISLVMDYTSQDDVHGVVWSGYVRHGCPASIPNIYVGRYMALRAQAYATAGGGNIEVRVSAAVQPEYGYMPAGSFIHYEAPGSGPGDINGTALATPAAGAAFAAVTVGDYTRVRYRATFAVYVNDANTGNRTPVINFQDSSGNKLAESPTTTLTQNTTGRVTWAPGFTQVNTSGTANVWKAGNMPDLVLPPGAKVGFAVDNIQAGDQWSDGKLLMEEWATP